MTINELTSTRSVHLSNIMYTENKGVVLLESLDKEMTS